MNINLLEAREKGKQSLLTEISLPCQQHWAVSPLGNSIDIFLSPNFKWQRNCQPLLLIGGVHGDEPEGVTLAESTLRWLNSVYLENKSPDVFRPWVLIPCINPDGYYNNLRVNGRGVDLNRNFPSSDWSPIFKADRYFPGLYPGSEPETRALVQLISKFMPRLVIHFHSWHPSITYTGSNPPSEAKILSQATGYPLQPDIGYPTPGSLGQFAWLGYHIPVICLEEQEHSDLKTVWPRFEAGIRGVFDLK